MAHGVIQDLRPAARNGIEPRSHQPPDGLAQVEAADLRDIGDFRSGEAVQVDGKTLLDAAEKVLVPLDLEVGVQAALHQHAGPAQVERLLDFFEDLLLGQHVPFRVPHGAVERAEAAIFGAEVGVVDIAVDDVRDDALGMPLAADGIGLHADADEVVGTEQIERFLASDHSGTQAVIPRYQRFFTADPRRRRGFRVFSAPSAPSAPSASVSLGRLPTAFYPNLEAEVQIRSSCC